MSAAKVPVSEATEVLEERLAQRFTEIAELTRLLSETEQENRRLKARIEWLHDLIPILRQGGFKVKFMNRWQNTASLAKLKRKGLFDASAYLAANPDVARAGVDPLRHYLEHGLREGRSRG